MVILTSTLLPCSRIGDARRGAFKHQPLHTHEEGDGTIHVESEDTRAYTLGDFFRVWGNRLTSTCLFDYCTGNGKVLSMKVNSGPSSEFENHVLRDGETIELRFE